MPNALFEGEHLPGSNSTRHSWLWSIFWLSSGMKSMTQRYIPVNKEHRNSRGYHEETMSPDGWIYPMILGESYKQYAGAARLKRRSRHRQRITDLWAEVGANRVNALALVPNVFFQTYLCRYLGVLISPNGKQASPAFTYPYVISSFLMRQDLSNKSNVRISKQIK